MYRQSLNHPRVTHREHGKPVILLEKSSRKFRKRHLVGLQVKECGKSECSSVMEEIGVNAPRESGQTSTRSSMTRELEETLRRRADDSKFNEYDWCISR